MSRREVATNTRRVASSGLIVLPSTLTILALCSGLSAVKFALDGELGIALAMIGVAAVLDSLDGRIARLLDATTKIGAELDSLADAISFGVAPALVLYVTLLDGSNAGWIVSLVYAVSIVLRLARFNTLLDDDTAPPYTSEFFVGIPAPAGALIALTPIAAHEQWGEGWWSSFWVVSAWTVLSAVLIVSRIPTLAMKTFSVPRRMAALLMVGVALTSAALITYPYVLLIVLVFAYLVHIPFAVHSKRWVAARPEVWDVKPAERRAIRRGPHGSRAQRSAGRLGLRRPGSR